MSATLILNEPQLSEKEERELREIFFETSAKKDFKDHAEKEAFFHKYLGFYLENYPAYVWVAKGSRILGYVVGMPNTDDPRVHQIQPHLKIFSPYFKDYPAHLHINLHAEARGMGLGSKLLQEMVFKLQEANITGLHIMTGPDSRNKTFYQRLGFDFEVTLNFLGSPILLMGKRLR
jgi:ribosomal protein S18 acetylase RimI-like enzyme